MVENLLPRPFYEIKRSALLDVRFKNKFFRSLDSQARAETRLKELVKNDVGATVFDDIEENIEEPVQVEIVKKGVLETIFARLREEANANQTVGQGDSVVIFPVNWRRKICHGGQNTRLLPRIVQLS